MPDNAIQAIGKAPQTPQRPGSLRTIAALILREVSMTNGRTALGYLWEIVDPVFSIIVITMILELFFRSPPLGNNFPLFYASGILPFSFFIETSKRVSTAIRFSRPLLAYPGVTFLHALLARFILAVATKSIIYVFVLFAIVEIYGLSVYFNYGYIALSLLLAFAAGLAVGSMNCLLLTFLPLYEQAWAVVTRPLFLFSAIVYLYETVPLPFRDWLWWNPVVHMVGLMRRGIYPTYDAPYVSVAYIAIIVALLIPVSFFFMRRYWREMIELM
jgi:capsular polysaccharide transport system permease protein